MIRGTTKKRPSIHWRSVAAIDLRFGPPWTVPRPQRRAGTPERPSDLFARLASDADPARQLVWNAASKVSPDATPAAITDPSGRAARPLNCPYPPGGR
jgi:hypothetical protein